jgi:hypothetical protein
MGQMMLRPTCKQMQHIDLKIVSWMQLAPQKSCIANTACALHHCACELPWQTCCGFPCLKFHCKGSAAHEYIVMFNAITDFNAGWQMHMLPTALRDVLK